MITVKSIKEIEVFEDSRQVNLSLIKENTAGKVRDSIKKKQVLPKS